MNNNMNNNMNNKPGCCANVHGKSFELILIVLFTLGAIIIAANFILTRWYFKQSYILFFIEIGLIALNGLCLLFTIMLRCWRSNGSVLNTNYSSSYCLSIFIIILIIINLLGSIGEEVLFYFVYYIITFDGNKNNTYTKIMDIYLKIMNNPEKNGLFSGKKEEIKVTILKILPWVCFSLNIFMQILGIIFINLIIKRIKLKSDFGIPLDILNPNGSAFQNGTALQNGSEINMNNMNPVNLENNNIHLEEKKEIKKRKEKEKDKIKKSRKSKKEKKEIFTNNEHDKKEKNKKSRNKKGKKKRSKSKNKDKSKSKNKK